MGFFNINNNDKQIKLKIAEKMISDSKETYKDIDQILSHCLKSQQQYESLSDQIIAFSKAIKEKLNTTETKKIEAITENVCDLHEDFITCLRMVSSIAEKQTLKTENAHKIHKKISQA